MSGAVETEYERRLRAANTAYVAAKDSEGRWTMALVVAVVVAIVAFVHGGVAGIGLGVAALVAALVLAVLMLRERKDSIRAWRKAALYERCLERVRGESPDSGFTGEGFAESGHLYAQDLTVVGKDSLFDRLATTRTAVGQRGLAELLLRPVEADVARERQAAVRELAGMMDLRERVALLGRFKFEDVPAESFERWLEAPRSEFAGWNRWAVLAATVGWIGAGVGGLLLRVNPELLWQNVGVALLIQGFLCFRIRPKVLEELESAQKLLGQTAILREGLKVMRGEAFGSARLQELQRAAEGEDRALAGLERQLAVVEQRPKEWFYPLSLATALGTHAAISLDAWKREFDGAMRRWLAAWAEFEGLLALATYAAEREENVWPEIVDSDATTAVFEAEGLRHPLLAADIAVANDVRLDGETQFLLISGSNMAGKSTLLRSIGTNVVLALAGAPVAAKRLRMNALQVGAAIAISDSLAEGKSKFLAEVERLRALVELARGHRGQMLFLIDEILSGTNSADRKAAAESVLRSLVAAGAVGAISTHDLTLAEIAEVAELHGKNVHMASPDEDDPLGFDYLLKPGMNQTTNAMAIVRMLGLG
jgi:hypothetical protein